GIFAWGHQLHRSFSMFDCFLLVPKDSFTQSEYAKSFTEIRLLAHNLFGFGPRYRERVMRGCSVPLSPREKSITPAWWKHHIFSPTHVPASSRHRLPRRFPITLTSRDIKPF